MDSTDNVLALVRKALDEFEDRPLDASVRRVVRVAHLLGETRTALRFSYELKAFGGDKQANGEDTKRLMIDPSTWGSRNGPAEEALQEFMNDRKASDNPADDKSLVHSIGELEAMANDPGYRASAKTVEAGLMVHKIDQIVARTRQRAFTQLCSWERQLIYSTVNEAIFQRFQARVDKSLSDGAPDLLDQFVAVYRRLREAAASNPEEAAPEELSQALTTCRRIFKAVVDHVLPAQDKPNPSGVSLNDPSYRNRLHEYLKKSIPSDSQREAVEAMCTGLTERFNSFDKLTNKAVHASVAREVADLCAINTYILCGEILRIAEAQAPVSD